MKHLDIPQPSVDTVSLPSRVTLTLKYPRSDFWMVWYVNSNRIRRRHPTREAAELEAERLAAAYPDRTFYVLHSGRRFGKPERAR